MAIYSPRLWWVAIALLLWAPHAHTREFTHEDIREAMLSLVHMIRMSEDKLERHELREKALGEQLKRMLNNLDKKHKVLEPLKGMISRLDDRLSNVETILLQKNVKEESEKAAQTKINDALENIQRTLTTLRTPDVSPSVNVELQRRLDATDAKIDAVTKEIRSLKSSLNPESLRSMCSDETPDGKSFETHLTEAEKLLTKYELKLSEFNGNTSSTSAAVQTDFVPFNEVAVADEAWHSKMTEVMERQENEIKKIQNLLSDAESMWKDLPRLADLHRSTNQTLEAISNATETVITSNALETTKIETKLREMGDRLVSTNEDIQNSLTQGNTMTERAYNDISRSYENLHKEVQLLSKSDALIQETSDNVMATKKRLEYVVNQVIMQLGEIIRGQHKNANRTVDMRLDDLESTIITNQTVALHNLNATLDAEISQVWRQIGIMHQQIIKSQTALNTFSAHTERYVNSSTATMDKVKNEVAGITTRMVEFGDNLNYVLGKLSMVTQEFKMMATGLNTALTNINKSTTASPDVKDAGPGPHAIPSEELPAIS